jgi:hypothetical protein
MAAIAAAVWMRRYSSTLEPRPGSDQARSTYKSATSRRNMALRTQQLAEWLWLTPCELWTYPWL